MHGVGAAAAFFGDLHLVHSTTTTTATTSAATTSTFLLEYNDTMTDRRLKRLPGNVQPLPVIIPTTLLPHSCCSSYNAVPIDAALVYSILIWLSLSLSFSFVLCAICAYDVSGRLPKLNKALLLVARMPIFVLLANMRRTTLFYIRSSKPL